MILGAFHGWPGSRGKIVERIVTVQRTVFGLTDSHRRNLISFLS